MKRPDFDLEDGPAKTVGKDSTAAHDYDRLVDAAEAIMPRLPIPKGVYRFRSFEEADAWTENQILLAARKKHQDHPENPT